MFERVCRKIILAFVILTLFLSESLLVPVLGLAAERVCVEDKFDALTRALRFHKKIGEEIAILKGVRAPERVFYTDDEFLNAVPSYLAGLPNSALILFAMDDDGLCAFLWHGLNDLLYARIDETLDGLNLLISELTDRIEQPVQAEVAAISEQLVALRSQRPSSQKLRSELLKSAPHPPDGHDLTYLQEKISRIIFPRAFSAVLRTVKHVTIVPLGAMSEMPVAFLRPVSDDSLVVDRFSVNYLLFAGEVRSGTLKRTGKFPGTLIFGNPKGTDAYWTLINLPEAETEATKAASAFGGEAFLRNDATRVLFYQRAEGADLIYIAAHAVADHIDPMNNSYIRLADGVLEARAVKDMKLKGPLVILSACQTGLGEVVTGGVIGFGRTFLDGGASNVIMSLWRVNDRAARYLMGELVDRLPLMAPAEALREAQVKTKEVYPKPAYWAAFSVYGNQQIVTQSTP